MTELLTQRLNKPMKETWEWFGFANTMDNGAEQRMDLSTYPRRSISGTIAFDDQAVLNRHLIALFVARGRGIYAPFVQYATPLTASVSSGAGSISFDPQRTQLADGDKALLFDESESAYELIEIAVVGAGSATIASGPESDWPARTLLCPVHEVFGAGNSMITRGMPDGYGSIETTLSEISPHIPFINPLNSATVDTLSSIPVIHHRPVGTSFEDRLVSGAENTDYNGVVDIRSRWDRAKLEFARTFRVRPFLDLADYEWWFALADILKGNTKPFWLPSWRNDFTIISAPAASGNQMTLEGHDFQNNYYPYDGLKGVFIHSDGGLHTALVTAIADSGANDLLTFSPALPAGTEYETNQRIGSMFKCRLTDGKFSWEHDTSVSRVTLNMITVDD